MVSRVCLNCGAVGDRLTGGRCNACRCYLYRNDAERPEEVRVAKARRELDAVQWAQLVRTIRRAPTWSPPRDPERIPVIEVLRVFEIAAAGDMVDTRDLRRHLRTARGLGARRRRALCEALADALEELEGGDYDHARELILRGVEQAAS